ncbi:hypothetical protein JNW90_26520 [Micromonospora sp. STR1s_5]|nr:hypothetical protein [Micromonospora sp. STR1s_5]
MLLMKALFACRPERGFTHWMPAPEPPPFKKAERVTRPKSKSIQLAGPDVPRSKIAVTAQQVARPKHEAEVAGARLLAHYEEKARRTESEATRLRTEMDATIDEKRRRLFQNRITRLTGLAAENRGKAARLKGLE